MGTQTAVHTPAFRNCVFQNLTFLNHLKKNITLTSFCNLKVEKCRKKRKKERKKKKKKIGQLMKKLCHKFILLFHMVHTGEILKNIVSGGWCMERKDTIQPMASLARKPMGDSSV